MADLRDLPGITIRFETLERISRDFLSGYQLSDMSQNDLEVVFLVLRKLETELNIAVANIFLQKADHGQPTES